MPEANTLILADKMCWLSLSGDSYCSGSPGGRHCFGLDDHNHGSFGVGEVKCEEVPSLFCIGDDLSMLHQGHCSGVIVVNNNSFSKLTK